MLKEYKKAVTKLAVFWDVCVIAASFVISYFLRARLDPDLGTLRENIVLLPLFVINFEALLYYLGVYNSLRIRKIWAIARDLFKASIVAFGVFSSVVYVFAIPHLDRSFIALVFVLTFVNLFLGKLFILAVSRYIRSKGYNYRNILIVGTGKRAQEFIKAIHQHSEWGLRIVGLIDRDEDKKGQVISGYTVLGAFDDVARVAHDNVIDEVVFVVPRSWLAHIEELMFFFETEGISIHLAVDYFQLTLSQGRQNELNGFPLITFETTPNKFLHLIFKRLSDIVISSLSLTVLSPFLLVISVLIKATSPGSVFFKQVRCGLNGRKFTMYKFRTMVNGAEARLEALLAKNQMQGPVFKMDHDPRVTRVGRLLRKMSLDELPQLFNVLKGDMSIVGPRPPIPKEVKSYEPWHRRRLSMRPGITCIWQVNGRNAITDFNRWTKLDLYYIDHWSLGLDLKIMLKTIPTVILGVGAK